MFAIADMEIPKVEIGGNVMIVTIVVVAVLVRLLLGYMRHKEPALCPENTRRYHYDRQARFHT